jgi:hypothetical protein
MRQYDLLDRAVLTSAPLNIEITTLLVTSSQAQVGRSSPRLPGGLGPTGPFLQFRNATGLADRPTRAPSCSPIGMPLLIEAG